MYLYTLMPQPSKRSSTMPPSENYRVVEPHPSVPNSTRPAIHTSRGGAGNVINLKNTPTTDSRTAMGPPSRARLDSSRVPKTFKSGRGGAGNVHDSSERAIFSFDEELERDMRGVAPVYHVGRGGAGNMIHDDSRRGSSSSASVFSSNYALSRKYSSSSSATSSSGESLSNADRAWDKARSTIGKGWGKLRGAT